MRTAVRAFFWGSVALLCASLVLTLIGGTMNLEGVLRTGTVAWWMSCVAFFLWAVAGAYASFGWFRKKGEGSKR